MLWYLGVVLLVGSTLGSAGQRRAVIGESVYTIDIPFDANFTETNESLTINEIQEDIYNYGNILVAIGNSIYRLDDNEYTFLVAGSGVNAPAGYANGRIGQALFNNIAGFVQLSYGVLLIADENNQCIRKLYRDTGYVEWYAGNCNQNHYYNSTEYINWETFNEPTKMATDGYDDVYVLDMLKPNEMYAILVKDLYSGEIQRYNFPTYGGQVFDFIYDKFSHSFAVSSTKGITNTSIYTSYEQQVIATMSGAYGLASYDNIVIVTNINRNTVTFIDGYENGNNFKICDNSFSWYDNLPDCSVNKPTSVAVVRGWLYIGSTVVEADGDGVKATLTKIRFSTPRHSTPKTTTTEESFTYPPINFPTFNPVPFDPPTINPPAFEPVTYEPDNYWDNDDDDDDYYSGMGGGTIAIIVIVTILLVGLKICLITWRVRRYRYRVRTRRVLITSGTTVSVQTTTRTRIPYGRLQEVTPATPVGNFPQPPPYSPGVYTPPPAPPTDAAPPAYTQSVIINPPVQPPPNARY